MKQALWMVVAVAVLAISLGGCDVLGNSKYVTPEREARGMIYVLPGIQGPDGHYQHVRDGLVAAGVTCAIKIHPWGCDIPGMNLLVNQTDTKDDRQWGQTIAKEIMAYQREYPGRYVAIIGQSGGGGVAVFTAESLANLGGKNIDSIVMLDASLSTDYNMSKAASKCSNGIVNFWYSKDTAMLVAGTGMFGNVDGGHGSSAGQTPITGRWPNLYQVRITSRMVKPWSDAHFADTTQAFATQYIAPWILHHTWPPYSPSFSK